MEWGRSDSSQPLRIPPKRISLNFLLPGGIYRCCWQQCLGRGILLFCCGIGCCSVFDEGIVVLPGGTGTLDELAEALSHKKLGLFDIPVVLLNTQNFFEPLLVFLQRMVDESFILPEHMNFIHVANTPEAVVSYLKNYQPLGRDTIRNMAAL